MSLGQAPEYLNSILPPSRNVMTERTLRSSQNITGIFARTETFKNSLFPRTIEEYNGLDPSIKLAPSVVEFKQMLMTDKPYKNPLFYLGDRKFSIIHAKLRMKCSSLNGHLYNLRIIDSPTCSCGHVFEGNYHFFMECFIFTLERETMIRKLTLIFLVLRFL